MRANLYGTPAAGDKPKVGALDALRNMSGAFDTPVARVRGNYDSFQEEAIANMREVLGGTTYSAPAQEELIEHEFVADPSPSLADSCNHKTKCWPAGITAGYMLRCSQSASRHRQGAEKTANPSGGGEAEADTEDGGDMGSAAEAVEHAAENYIDRLAV